MTEKETIKSALKDALSESLLENRDFCHKLVSEVLEDYAMVEAIHEGRKTELTERSEVFKILDHQSK